jgi:hypothetical protein
MAMNMTFLLKQTQRAFLKATRVQASRSMTILSKESGEEYKKMVRPTQWIGSSPLKGLLLVFDRTPVFVTQNAVSYRLCHLPLAPINAELYCPHERLWKTCQPSRHHL